MDFNQSFEQLCKERRVTQAQVARDLEISQSTVASWKSRNLTPNARTLNALAKYFDVSIAYLLGEIDDPEKGKGEPHWLELESQAKSEALRRDILIDAYDSLNAKGKKRVLDHAVDIKRIPEYQSEEYKERKKQLDDALNEARSRGHDDAET